MASGIYEAYFIYLSAPIVGAIVAALAYEHLILKRADAAA